LTSFACAQRGGDSNQYLPPDKGYAYDKPNQPFPSQNKPQQVPFPRQPGPQGPPAPAKPYVPPQADDVSIAEADVFYKNQFANLFFFQHVHEPGMPFDFAYNVNDAETANDYSHKAVSDGDVTRGEYRVQMPDGRTQVVKYTADWKNGYNAEVTYEGEAQYPDQPAATNNNNKFEGYKY
jgi:Insect cuticle protein